MSLLQHQSSSLKRLRLATLFLLASFTGIMIIAAGYHLNQQYADVTDTNLRAARGTLRAVTSDASQILGEAFRVTEGIADVYEGQLAMGRADELYLHNLMVEKVARAQAVLGFVILDQNRKAVAGTIIYPIDPDVPMLVGMPSEGFVDVGTGFLVGPLFRNNREGPNKGLWLLPLAAEITGVHGEARGHVIAVIDVRFFSRYFDSLDVGSHGHIEMWAATGHLVAATKNANAQTGEFNAAEVSHVSNAPAPAAPDREVVHMTPGIEADEIVANDAVGNLPLAVSVVLDGRDFLTAWRSTRNLIVVMVAAIMLAMMAFVFIILRQLNRTEQNALALRQAKVAAEEASDAKSRFLAHMSHEFRTPLNAIMGFSEIIKNKVLGGSVGSEYVSYAEHIHRSGEHLLNIVNDILDMAKIESGVQLLRHQAIDARAVARAAVSFVEGIALQRDLRLRVAVPDYLPQVLGDERFSRQVLINLLSNAIKFSPPGAEIVISAIYIEGKSLDISVRDHGPGIEPGILKRLGEPFLQGNPSLSHSGQGTGLGLSICKRYMDLLGGELIIESAEGTGTTATIRFPRHLIVVPDKPASRSVA